MLEYNSLTDCYLFKAIREFIRSRERRQVSRVVWGVKKWQMSLLFIVFAAWQLGTAVWGLKNRDGHLGFGTTVLVDPKSCPVSQ